MPNNNVQPITEEYGIKPPVQELLSRKTFNQLVKYFITGVLSFGTDISLVYLFTDVFKLWYIYSNSLALLIVFILNFTLNRFWAFKSQQPFLKQLITSGALFLLNLLISDGVMFIFTDKVHLLYLYSKVIATGLTTTWNFFLYKYYVYK